MQLSGYEQRGIRCDKNSRQQFKTQEPHFGSALFVLLAVHISVYYSFFFISFWVFYKCCFNITAQNYRIYNVNEKANTSCFVSRAHKNSLKDKLKFINISKWLHSAQNMQRTIFSTLCV